jgi:hypothetical protein
MLTKGVCRNLHRDAALPRKPAAERRSAVSTTLLFRQRVDPLGQPKIKLG